MISKSEYKELLELIPQPCEDDNNIESRKYWFRHKDGGFYNSRTKKSNKRLLDENQYFHLNKRSVLLNCDLSNVNINCEMNIKNSYFLIREVYMINESQYKELTYLIRDNYKDKEVQIKGPRNWYKHRCGGYYDKVARNSNIHKNNNIVIGEGSVLLNTDLTCNKVTLNIDDCSYVKNSSIFTHRTSKIVIYNSVLDKVNINNDRHGLYTQHLYIRASNIVNTVIRSHKLYMVKVNIKLCKDCDPCKFLYSNNPLILEHTWIRYPLTLIEGRFIIVPFILYINTIISFVSPTKIRIGSLMYNLTEYHKHYNSMSELDKLEKQLVDTLVEARDEYVRRGYISTNYKDYDIFNEDKDT